MSTDVVEEGSGSGGSSDEPPAGLYSIISVGTWARYITGTLTDDTWEVLAQDVTFHDGEWPRADDGTDQGTLTLHPLDCLEAAEDVQFRAIYNEVEMRYDVWAACCPPE